MKKLTRRTRGHDRLAMFLAAALPWGSAHSEAGPEATSWTSGPQQIIVDGVEREFLLDVPSQLKPDAPLVLVFHGYTGSAKSMRESAGFTALTKKHSFVAAYPQGTRDSRDNTFFNVGYEFHADSKVDDVEFVRQLTARLVKDLQLDAAAVFATGMSNGGDMSYFLASQKKPFVQAIAPVAGTMMKSWADGFRPAVRIPVLHVHGTADNITKWQGDVENRDGWGAYLGLDDVLAKWVDGMQLERSDVTQLPRAKKTDRKIELQRRSTAADDAEVLLYKIHGGGHDWPEHLGDPHKTTAEVIWDFFEKHRRQ